VRLTLYLLWPGKMFLWKTSFTLQADFFLVTDCLPSCATNLPFIGCLPAPMWYFFCPRGVVDIPMRSGLVAREGGQSVTYNDELDPSQNLR
jgi:hypothetical protein